jgi:hypothetical protein
LSPNLHKIKLKEQILKPSPHDHHLHPQKCHHHRQSLKHHQAQYEMCPAPRPADNRKGKVITWQASSAIRTQNIIPRRFITVSLVDNTMA